MNQSSQTNIIPHLLPKILVLKYVLTNSELLEYLHCLKLCFGLRI